MARFKATPQGNVPFTAEEEAQADAHEAQWVAEQVELAKLAYRDRRKEEYPPFTDYLDGIVKGDQEQVQAYIEACLAVKLKYPKINRNGGVE
jgi:hypothetical protein